MIFGLKLDLFRTKSEEESGLLFQSEDKLDPKNLTSSRSYFIGKISVLMKNFKVFSISG